MMKKFLTIVLFLAIFQISSNAQSEGLSPLQLQQQAASLYRAGRYGESIHLYRQLANQQPNDPEVLRDLMWALWKAGRVEETMKVATQIKTISPEDVDALNMLARSKQEMGNDSEAMENYKHVLEQEPHNSQVRIALARLYEQQGKLAEAEKLYTQAAVDAPGMLEIYPWLAKNQTLQGHYEAAAQSWEKALKKSPNKSEFRFQQGKALYLANDIPRALEIFRGLLKDKTQRQPALDMLVTNALENGRLEEAAGLLENNVNPPYQDSDQNRLLKLARIYGDIGQINDALATLTRLLDFNPENPAALVLKGNYLYDNIRDYKGAETLFKAALVQNPDSPKVFPKLATAQYLQGNFADASQTWKKALQTDPSRSDFKFKLAQSMYYNKQYSEAIQIMYGLLDDNVQKIQASDFILGDLLSRSDLPSAITFLEKYPMEGNRYYELACLYRDIGETQKCLKTLDKHLTLHPDDTSAWLLKAESLMVINKKKLVLKLYEKIQAMNPNSTLFMIRTADAQYEIGRKKKAIETLLQARKLDPTNPYLMMREANYRYDIGDFATPRKMLTEWLHTNKEPSLPVLVYHGLTPFSRDPLLLHPYHMTNAIFQDQVRAIKKAGFNSVTARQVVAWIKGQGKLPERPIMITFDDGRMDSFKNADPILKDNGMKATMFMIVGNIERNLPNYANWEDLARFQATGRWDIQAHGDQGHNHIVVDEKGDKAFFIARKLWLAEKRRMETDQEWSQRILKDHLSAREKLGIRTGSDPIAFAFPEGNFSQFNLTDSPSPLENIALARKVFNVAFHEDEFGINNRLRDPGLWVRYMPGQSQTGEDLARFLTDRTPFSMARKTLLRWCLWEQKPREAMEWLAELKKGGASEYCVLIEEARIHAAQHDLATAEELIKKAYLLIGKPLTAGLQTPSVSPRMDKDEETSGDRNPRYERNPI